MLQSILNFFAKPKASKDVAKDRLKLVLIHDRANVSPELLEMIKSEIIKVITNYIDIDENELDIQLTKTQSDDGHGIVPALIANIPIRNLKPKRQQEDN